MEWRHTLRIPRNPDKIDYIGGLPEHLDAFDIIEDPRTEGNTRHHFGEILFTSVRRIDSESLFLSSMVCALRSRSPGCEKASQNQYARGESHYFAQRLSPVTPCRGRALILGYTCRFRLAAGRVLICDALCVPSMGTL